jgi:alpha-N-arabinofuranosidase
MVALGIRGDEERRSNMGRETHLIPVTWEPATVRWEQVSETRWEPVEYMWPVCAPNTGRVERFTALPFEDSPQYRNNVFTDNFDSDQLDLEWNFRRVPMDNTYSLEERQGFLRLYLKSGVIRNRGRCSLMGIRQGESDFEFSVSMDFLPGKDGEEAGMSLFQQDDNYIMFTTVREGKDVLLSLRIKERGQDARVEKSLKLEARSGEIIFKAVSLDQKYRFGFSTDEGETYKEFAELPSTLILSNGYTGAYLGLYATSNGNSSRRYADFDWVTYKGFERD